MSVEERLVALKSKSDKLNTLRIETQTKLKALEEEKEKLLAECKELGVDPQRLEETVKEEEKALLYEISLLEEKIGKVHDALRKI